VAKSVGMEDDSGATMEDGLKKEQAGTATKNR
jgi:hypothetical protein